MSGTKKRPDVETIGRRLDDLNMWDALLPYNFAVKPRGTVFPYFCTVLKGDGKPVKARLLMLEGWQTMHDFVRTRVDNDFGFYSSPIEFPHFELIVVSDGAPSVYRDDPGYLPRELKPGDPQRDLVAKILWEAYGVFLRVEGDPALPLKFAEERAVFARVEGADGAWSDEPLAIPDPAPHKEVVAFPKELLKAAKDLPFVADDALELDFRMLAGVMTQEERPRCAYELLALDGKTGETAFQSHVSVSAEATLRTLWESMPAQVLHELVKRGKVPGAIRVRSGRVFRMLRPLCLDFPFKLSLHDSLEHLK
jgi:hypothetical protein